MKVWIIVYDGCDDGTEVAVHATKKGALDEAVKWQDKPDAARQQLIAEGWCDGSRNTTITLKQVEVQS